MKTKEEILMEIIDKQDELIDILTHFKHLSEPNRYFNRKHELLDEINALKSQLAEAGEEKRNKLIKAYSDLVIEIDKHKGTTLKEVKLRNKIANLKLEIR